MKNKELQEQRMRGYFLQATKDLLKAEGLKSISVRNIADRAGYSYATLYSYFKDVNDLIFLCVRDFFEECRRQVNEQGAKRERGIKSLRTSVRSYCDYFIQYPGIFELFFLEKIENFKEKKEIADAISCSLDTVCEEDWNACVGKGLIDPEQVELCKTLIRHSVTGLLLLYLNRRMPASYTEFLSRLNAQLDAILGLSAANHPGSGASGGAGRDRSNDDAGSSGGRRDRGGVGSGSKAMHNSIISINIGNNK